jgi:hypothetical protein
MKEKESNIGKEKPQIKFRIFLHLADNRSNHEDCVLTPCIVGTRFIQNDFSIHVIGVSWIYWSFGVCLLAGHKDSEAFKKISKLKGIIND